MSKARTRLFRSKTLRDCHPPNLSVIRDDWVKLAHRLGFCATDAPLQRIQAVFEPVVDVVNLGETNVGEVHPEYHFEFVVPRVLDRRLILGLNNGSVNRFAPAVPRSFVQRNSNLEPERTLRHFGFSVTVPPSCGESNRRS